MTTAAQQDRKVDGWISDLVGALKDPVICHRGQEMQPPEWLRNTITLQRLIENVAAAKEGRSPTGTDAEATWYLSTASLDFPFDSDWTDIYTYCFTKTYENFRTKESGCEVPPDIRQDSLNNYQMGELRHLKDWIYKVRCEHRRGVEKAERLEQKEIQKAQKRKENPTLFDFFEEQASV